MRRRPPRKTSVLKSSLQLLKELSHLMDHGTGFEKLAPESFTCFAAKAIEELGRRQVAAHQDSRRFYLGASLASAGVIKEGVSAALVTL